VLLSVGGLITRKRHDLVIRSLPHIPGATLLIVGSGPERGALETLCREVGVEQRVRFLGSIPHERMADVYSAGDVLILASSREGWANVLLEAMACGTPTIATKVWGAPEVITAIQAGRLLDEATPEAVARSVCALLRNPPRREDTRHYAEAFSWDATTIGQLELFREILDRQ
jgi:glycosyltransferase involved in cell wall biosynthesis